MSLRRGLREILGPDPEVGDLGAATSHDLERGWGGQNRQLGESRRLLADLGGEQSAESSPSVGPEHDRIGVLLASYLGEAHGDTSVGVDNRGTGGVDPGLVQLYDRGGEQLGGLVLGEEADGTSTHQILVHEQNVD